MVGKSLDPYICKSFNNLDNPEIDQEFNPDMDRIYMVQNPKLMKQEIRGFERYNRNIGLSKIRECDSLLEKFTPPKHMNLTPGKQVQSNNPFIADVIPFIIDNNSVCKKNNSQDLTKDSFVLNSTNDFPQLRQNRNVHFNLDRLEDQHMINQSPIYINVATHTSNLKSISRSINMDPSIHSNNDSPP